MTDVTYPSGAQLVVESNEGDYMHYQPKTEQPEISRQDVPLSDWMTKIEPESCTLHEQNSESQNECFLSELVIVDSVTNTYKSCDLSRQGVEFHVSQGKIQVEVIDLDKARMLIEKCNDKNGSPLKSTIVLAEKVFSYPEQFKSSKGLCYKETVAPHTKDTNISHSNTVEHISKEYEGTILQNKDHCYKERLADIASGSNAEYVGIASPLRWLIGWEECQKGFSSKELLDEYSVRDHGQGLPCLICGQSFPSRTSLDGHCRSHNVSTAEDEEINASPNEHGTDEMQHHIHANTDVTDDFVHSVKNIPIESDNEQERACHGISSQIENTNNAVPQKDIKIKEEYTNRVYPAGVCKRKCPENIDNSGQKPEPKDLHSFIESPETLSSEKRYEGQNNKNAQQSRDPQACIEYTETGHKEKRDMKRLNKKLRKENLKCPHCEETFVVKRAYRVHLKTHMTYDCVICGQKMKNKKSLRAHQKKKHPEMTGDEKWLRSFKCYCGRKFTTDEGLKLHQKDDPHNYICEYCGATYNSKSKLVSHTNGHEKPFKCQLCPKAYSRATVLKDHLKMHSGVRDFICEMCGKAFPLRSALKKHYWSHTGERRYKCEVCSKDFTSLSALSVHVRTHIGEKPYICRFCDKAFIAGSYLKQHERIHTGEKPYVCKQCGEAFIQRNGLRSHCSSHHHYYSQCPKIGRPIQFMNVGEIVTEELSQPQSVIGSS